MKVLPMSLLKFIPNSLGFSCCVYCIGTTGVSVSLILHCAFGLAWSEFWLLLIGNQIYHIVFLGCNSEGLEKSEENEDSSEKSIDKAEGVLN